MKTRLTTGKKRFRIRFHELKWILHITLQGQQQNWSHLYEAYHERTLSLTLKPYNLAHTCIMVKFTQPYNPKTWLSYEGVYLTQVKKGDQQNLGI